MITVAQVTKRFGRITALEGVTLTIGSGEHVAFVGANGSGKTTLLRALLGLVRVEGRITIGGVDVAREPEMALRTVAYIPQIAPPIDAPVREVVRTHAALRGKDEEETWKRAARLGLDTAGVRGKRFTDLSGGMKQKLLAAMALASEAPVLVCDEPTANLDGDARASFFEQLAERPRTGIVVLCSHRIEEVRQLVRRVVELGDGKVVRDAPIEDLLRDPRAGRVEITVRDGARGAEELLRIRGFDPCGAGRFVADLAQSEKLQLLTQVLAELGADVVDLGVTPIADLYPVARAAPRRAGDPRTRSGSPHLKVVR
jgi:ABC-type multidrug transport system ATPase subunit